MVERTPPALVTPDPAREQAARRDLKRLLANGPLTAMPARPPDQALLSVLAASRFEPDREYLESDVNLALKAWLSAFCAPFGIDHVTLRRMLVDARLLSRTRSGSFYRLNREKLGEVDGIRAIDPAQVLVEVREVRERRKQHRRASLQLSDYDSARADELVALWRESFEGGVGIVDPHPVAEQLDFLTREVIPNNTIRMAMEGGRLVGFVAATRQSVSHLYVRSAEQRRGIGSQMLAWAKAQSSGHLWLFTFARNERARRFYEKHGFRIVARGFESTWQLEDIKYEWSESSQGETGEHR